MNNKLKMLPGKYRMSLLITFWKHLGRRIEQTGKTAGQMKTARKRLPRTKESSGPRRYS